MYDDEGAVHHPRRRYEIPWAAIGQRAEAPREKKGEKERKKEAETIADRKEAERWRRRSSAQQDEEEEEEEEDGKSFRIYRRSCSNRTARGHAAAECSPQPALRM